jgi:VCBS repeat-containing protein
MNSNLIRLTKTVTVSVWLILCAFNASAAEPIAVDDTYNVIEGGSLTIAAPGFLANDSDPDGDTFQAVSFDPPLTGVTAFADGRFTYNHDGAEVASVFFGIIIRDASGLDSVEAEIITINIDPVDDNTPAVTGIFNGSVTEGNVGDAVVTASNTISITDADFHQSPTFATNQSGIYGTVDVTTTPGSWVYTLDQSKVQALDAGETVTDAVELVASDGTVQIISITITGTNDVATLPSPVVALEETDTTLSTGGTLTITDQDASPATIVPQSIAKVYGAFSIDAAGVWTYVTNSATAADVLNDGQTVSEVLNVTTTDGGSATITVNITGTEDISTLTSETKTIVETDAVISTNGALVLNDRDAATASVTTQTNTSGTYGVFNILASGAWTYTTSSDGAADTITLGQTKAETFTVSTTDGRSATVNINITGTNDIGTLTCPVVALTETDTTLSTGGTLTITDKDATPATIIPANIITTYANFGIDAAGVWSYVTKSPTAADILNNGEAVREVLNFATTDGGTATITVNITGTEDISTLTSETKTLVETDAVITTDGALALNDKDAATASVTAQTETAGTYGLFNILASGVWTYATSSDSAADSITLDQTKVETFNVSTTDGGSATVNINITGTNDVAAITATDATGDVEEDNILSVSGSLSVTDGDADQAEFIAQTGIASTYGSFSISTSGDWQFVLDNASVAVQGLTSKSIAPEESFTVFSNDSSASTTVSITVNGMGDDPVLAAATIDVPENADSGAEVLDLLALTTDKDSDETFTYSILSGTSLPAEFTIDSATGTLSVSDYAPGEALLDFESATAPNPYILTIQVIDSSEGRVATAPITINIIDYNYQPGDTLCETYTGTTPNGIVAATDLESTLDRLGLFTPANPCQRVILTGLNYQMDEGNLLSAVIGTDGLGNAVTVPSDVGNINYREALDAKIINDQDQTSDLNFYLVGESIAATGGQLDFKKGADLKTTGEFEYTPDAGLLAAQANPFIGEFIYQACDTAIEDFPTGETEADRCAYGVARIVVKPAVSDGANVDTNLQYNDLSQGPLELPRAALPNVFVVMDNSADQASDILTDQLEGLYQYDSSGGGTPAGNAAPVAISDSYQVNSGTGANATITATAGIGGSGVLGNDYDAECDALTVTDTSSGSNPKYGTLTLNNDGSFTYVHTETNNNKKLLSDQFSYTVSDGTTSSAEVTVTISMISGTTPVLTDSGNTCTPGGTADSGADSDTATHLFESIPGGTQAPTEADLPGQGLWRLRNSDFNKVYYNPAVLYEPWSGSRVNNQPFEFREFSGTTMTGFDEIYTEKGEVTLSNAPDLAKYYIWNQSSAYEGVGTDGNDDDVVDINEQGKLIEIVTGVVLPPKAITRTDCAADPCTYEEELKNFANYYTYARTRLNTFKGALSSVVASAENMNVGFGGFQGQSNNVPLELMLESPFAGAKKILLDNMLSMKTPSSASAAYAALDKVGSYYEGDNSNSIISGISGSPITYSCQQNFALWVSGGVAGTKAFNPGAGVSDENVDGDLLFAGNVSSITPVPVAGTGTNIGTLTLVDSGRWSYVLDDAKYAAAYPLGLGDGQVVFDNFTVSDGTYSKTVNVAITGVLNGADIVVPTPQEGGGTVAGNTDWDGGRYGDQQPVATGNNALVSLADIAMYYYERDLSPLADEVPATELDKAGADASAFGGTALDPNMHQHMSTFVVAFGVGVPDSLGITKEAVYSQPYTAPFEWTPAVGGGVLDVATEEGRLVDLLHAAVNGRGDYLSAGNPDGLKLNLENAFLQFSQAIGTASAVSFNSQEIQEGTNVFRAFYNIRENTGDLVAQELDPVTGLGDVNWSAAAKLDTRFDYVTVPDATGQTDNRQILSYNSVIGSGIAFKAAEMSTAQTDVLDLGTNDSALLADHVNYLRGDASNERPSGNLRPRPAELGRMGDVINSTPVFYGAPNRERREAEPFAQLKTTDGNYESSYTAFQAKYTILPTPIAGESPDPALIKRTGMVYVGSNDGMLHGFNANTGDEVFAYIPELLITGAYSQRLTQLLGDDYAHRFTVDLTAGVNDVYMDLDPTGTSDPEWLTMLIGGYRAGAKGYFALDITDPTGSVESTKAITEATAADRVLWEFDDTDDSAAVDAGPDAAGSLVGYPRTTILAGGTQTVSDLGYTFSQPTIAISNVVLDDTNAETAILDGNRWLAAFGNGYESTSGNAALYIMFPGGGIDGDWCNPAKNDIDPLCTDLTENDFVKIVLEGRSSTGVPNGLSQPRVIDTDGNGTADMIYAGDRFGNLYRTDIRSADPTDWSKPENTVLLFSATHSYQDPTLGILVEAPLEQPQPITTQPIVVPHPQAEGGGYMVVFTTGSYIYDGDDTFDATVESELRQKGTESIYGIWDRSFDAITVEKNALTQRNHRALNDPVLGTPVRIFDPADTTVIDYGTPDPVTNILPRGWYLDFANLAPVGDGVLSLAQTTPETPRLAQYPGEKAIRNLQTRGGIVFVNSVNPKEFDSCSIQAGGAANAFCPSQGNLECNLGAIFDTTGDGDVNEEDQSTLADGSRYTVASMFFEGSVPTDSTFIGDQRVTQLSDQSLAFTTTDTNDSSKVGRISWKLLKSISE